MLRHIERLPEYARSSLYFGERAVGCYRVLVLVEPPLRVAVRLARVGFTALRLSLIHISEPTRPY